MPVILVSCTLGFVAGRAEVASHGEQAESNDRGITKREVFFSPKGGCTEAVIREVGVAKTTIRVFAYSFTSRPIAQALAAAKGRGVDVKAVLDGSNADDRNSAMSVLTEAGCQVLLDTTHAIMHNKVIVVDGSTVMTGSFNFTAAGEARNAENLLVMRDPSLAAKYEANWAAHAAHSR